MASISPRVQLRDTALEQGEQLLEVTKLGSLTELISVMFSRYGKHLEATWEVQPTPGANLVPAEPSPLSMGGMGQESPQPNFQFDEPLTGL
jgi:hypothetical protein